MCKAIVEIENKNQEIGKEIGKDLGRKEELVSLVKDGLLQLDIAAKRAGMTTKEFEKLLKNE